MRGKNEKGIRSASMLIFLKKKTTKKNWHIDCIYLRKSDTLISFLLKKVYFVPQSRPFSIYASRIDPSPVSGVL
jgi:hypothetical protein